LKDDPQTSVYDAYVRLKDIPKGASLYLGRQFVYTAVGSALLDGVRAKYRLGQSLEFQIFGGSRVSRLFPEKIRSLSDNGSFGGRAGYLLTSTIRFGLNWMWSRSNGDLAFHRAGLDAEKTLDRGRVYSRLTFDVAGRRLDEFLFQASYRPGPWYVGGEFTTREPRVAYNSLFSLIETSQRQEARASIQRTVWRQLAVLTQMQVSFLGDDRVWHGSIGVRSTNYHIAWRQQGGDGGDRNGLVGYVSHVYHDRWEFFATADVSRYRVQPEQEVRSDAYAASLGVRWRSGGGLSAGLEGQYLRNAVDTEDYRLLLQVRKNFSLGRSPRRDG
jgi:hypothetical protein